MPTVHTSFVVWESRGFRHGGGLTGRGPVPPWNPFVRELAAGLALAESASSVDPTLRSSVLRLAADQINSPRATSPSRWTAR